MLMTDLIAAKRDGRELSTEQIQFMINNFTSGSIPDYQMASMCMAILFRGMNDREILDLTLAMERSGDILDLSGIKGVKADKHSTGGVGDKTTLVLCPMIAALGVKFAKMSGRGLGHTGGTIDKLESFPGFTTAISEEQFISNVNRIGIAIAGQTGNLVPADKKMYALRDVTGTVPSVPLIVSSIMSKKLAAGADVIVLDVKCGEGSFMKTKADAEKLASQLVRVGKLAGKKVTAVITDMDEPLGYAVGNALEVKEAIAALNGAECGELMNLCLTLGSYILIDAGMTDKEEEARSMLRRTVEDGSALKKLVELVEAQGGDPAAVYDTSRLPDAPVKMDVRSSSKGYVKHIAAENVGLVSMHLGGGRITKDSEIDLSVGVVLNKKVGDHVDEGEVLGTVHATNEEAAAKAADELRACYFLTERKGRKEKFVKAVVR
ncbi:MAG: pyrimidine-nucleoside phosphorylase [Oscillospiraceae bacterium]|nr:pyrimidine-nucleoside phosphorylase [Oscillospiraceae bacterium]